MTGDISNLGRCDACGETIDMSEEGAGDEVVVMEPPEEALGGAVTREQIAEGMADALRRSDAPIDHTLAAAYEEEPVGEVAVHADCFEASQLAQMVEPVDTDAGEEEEAQQPREGEEYANE